MPLSRRHWLRLAAAAAPALFAADPPKRNVIVRSARPEDFEMPLDAFGSWITPVERFFVRSHVYTPAVDAATWKLSVEGEVESALALDRAALDKFPRAELVSVLECAGNGRSFYQPTIVGMPWEHGAVGNARWAGVRLADVLRQARVKPGAGHVAFEGADQPIGTMPDFARSIPMEKAMHPDTLLAFEMNGAPLTASHGFPARIVAPGWAGDCWIKWLTGIRVLREELDSFWMKTAYRYPVQLAAPGVAIDPAQMAPVTALRVKSVIASPAEGQALQAGAAVQIQGAAWSGDSPIVRVEVSSDSGRSWRAARLGPDRARYGWRLWQADWKPSGAGSHVLMARATDAAGTTQPLVADWNPSGYLWNAVHHVRVEVGATPPGAPAVRASIPEFPAKTKAACIGCHGEDIIAGQRLTRGQWEREVDKMIRWGAKVPAEDRGEILDFLSRHFGAMR
jgi:sulfite oxidase